MTRNEFFEECAYYNNCSKCPYADEVECDYGQGLRYICTVNIDELEDD